MTDTVDTGTELALFPKLNLPSVTALTEEMNKSFGTMYTRIEEEMRHLPTDMTVKANRERVASFAYSIARTKTGLDKAAAGTVESAKEIVDAVNTERRQLKNTLDILKDKARAPLDAWEEAEAQKKQKSEDAIRGFQSVASDHAGESSLDLAMVLDNLKRWQFKEEHYGERIEDVKAAHAIAVERIAEMFEVQARHEAEAAELEQLRREKLEREQKEAEERAAIARAEAVAAQAERDRIAAEQKAEADRIERERIAEEARQAAAREAQEQIEAAKREAAEAAEREQRTKEAAAEAEARAEREREAAAAEAAREATRREQEAAQRERDKIAAEKAQEERERLAKERADQERAADLAHRKKLNGEAVAAIVKACELTDEQAKAVVIAIYKGQIPHVSITY